MSNYYESVGAIRRILALEYLAQLLIPFHHSSFFKLLQSD
jgi:hypothetical protein